MSGSIYRRKKPDGTWSKWYAVIDDVPGPDGKRRQRTTSHLTRTAAQQWLVTVAARRQLQKSHGDSPTVGQYLEDWLADKQSLRASTRLSYAGHMRRHLIPRIGHIALSALTRDDLIQMFAQIRADAERRDAPLAARSLEQIRSTLSSALTDAVHAGLIEVNPLTRVQLPPAPALDRSELWTVKQLNEFLSGIESDPLYPLVVLLAMRGLRRGEGLGLRWCDVDLQRREIHVRQQLVSVGGTVMAGPPKTAAGRRTIAMDPFTEQVLRKHEGRQRYLAIQHNWEITPQTLLFTSPEGKTIDPVVASRRFGRLVAQSGLPHMRLHDLRHLSATLGLQSGESLKEVQTRLGHSSIAVTADIYTEVSSTLAAQSARRLAKEVTTHA